MSNVAVVKEEKPALPKGTLTARFNRVADVGYLASLGLTTVGTLTLPFGGIIAVPGMLGMMTAPVLSIGTGVANIANTSYDLAFKGIARKADNDNVRALKSEFRSAAYRKLAVQGLATGGMTASAFAIIGSLAAIAAASPAALLTIVAVPVAVIGAAVSASLGLWAYRLDRELVDAGSKLKAAYAAPMPPVITAEPPKLVA